MTVALEIARADQRVIFDNLFQLYTHDFSEFWAGLPRGDVDAQGRFPPYPYLDAYWQEEGRVPLLLRVDGATAGFALLNRHGHAKPQVERNMAEFFVLRKYRRGGIGSAAVAAIFEQYPGEWETAVARKNTAALAFWRKVISAHPRVTDLAEQDLATAAWNGPVLSYRVSPARL